MGELGTKFGWEEARGEGEEGVEEEEILRASTDEARRTRGGEGVRP